jgi:hypothetical protein
MPDQVLKIFLQEVSHKGTETEIRKKSAAKYNMCKNPYPLKSLLVFVISVFVLLLQGILVVVYFLWNGETIYHKALTECNG